MRGTPVLRFIVLSGIAVAAFAGPAMSTAQAQISSREGIALQNQIEQLSQQMQQVQQMRETSNGAVSSSSRAAPAASGDLVSQLLQRVATLENENRDMRGALDQLTNQVQTDMASLKKQIADMQFAAQNGGAGGGAGAGAGAASPADMQASSAPAAKPVTAIELLKSGQEALRAHDYASAQSSAEQALRRARTVNGKIDSQFLLAQSLAGQKQYRDSAVAYFDAYKRAPKSTRAQEALLGVSASMLALGDKNSACEALKKLQTEFPSPTPRVRSAMTSFKGRASCH